MIPANTNSPDAELAGSLAMPAPGPSALDLPHGMHFDVPEEQYHRRCAEVASKHGLDLMLKAARLYKMASDEPEDEEAEEEHFGFGRALHCRALTPQIFADTYVVSPNFGPLRADKKRGVSTEEGKANKERRDAWLKENAGKTLLEYDNFTTICGMCDSLLEHELTGPLIRHGRHEITLRWRDRLTGVEAKARPDTWHDDLGLVSDIKGLRDGSWDGFRLASERYGYARQDAWYRRGMAATGHTIGAFIFACCEKREPYLVSCFEHTPEDHRSGQ